MANSAVVGILRALLIADTAQFDKNLKRSNDDLKVWSSQLKQTGQKASALGASLTQNVTLPILAVGAGVAKMAMDFESSFANVRKTVGGTTKELDGLAMQFREMSKSIPMTTTELNKIAALGGQMGVATENLGEFTKHVAFLGVAVDGISTEEAAAGLAQIGNAAGFGTKYIAEMASTLVHLGNNSAATEGEILEFTKRLTGAGTSIGLTVPQIMALGTAMASVGINAEAGGSAFSMVMQHISLAVSNGGSKLEEFARVAGKSSAEFAKTFKEAPMEAIQLFIQGLSTMKQRGIDLNLTMGELGENGIRVQNTLKLLAGGAGLVTKALVDANEGWTTANKHQIEAEKKFATTANQLKVLMNQIRDVGVTLGNALLPGINSAIDAFKRLMPLLEGFADWFSNIPGPVQALIFAFAGLLAAIGPIIFIFGQLITSTSLVIGAFAKGGIATTALGATFTWLAANPIVAVIVGLGLLAAAVYTAATADTALEKQYKSKSVEMDKENDRLHNAITSYEKLATKTDLTAWEMFELAGATKVLAEKSGLTTIEFLDQTRKSDDLVRSLKEQKDALWELGKEQREAAQVKRIEAGAAHSAAEQRRQDILAGKVKVQIGSDFGYAKTGEKKEREMTPREMQEAAAVEQVRIDRLKHSLDLANAAYDKLTGNKLRDKDINLANAKVEKETAEERQRRSKEQQEAYEKERERLEKLTEKYTDMQKMADMTDIFKEMGKGAKFSAADLREFVNEINDLVLKGRDVPQVLNDFRIANIGLLDTFKVTKQSAAEVINMMGPGFELAALQGSYSIYGLSGVMQDWANMMADPRGMPKIMALLDKTGVKMAELKDKTKVWADGIALVFDGITTSITDSFASAITQAESFGDAFVNVWETIKKKVTDILGDILNMFVNQFIKGMISSLMGSQGGFGAAFSNIYGKMIDAITGKAIGTTVASVGTQAAVGGVPGLAMSTVNTSAVTGAGTGAGGGGAAAGGAGSTLAMVAGPVAGAGVGYAVGNYVGYKTGSKTKGALAGAGAGAGTGVAIGSFAGPAGAVVGGIVGGIVGAVAGAYGAMKAGKDINKMRDKFLTEIGGGDKEAGNVALEAQLKTYGREDLYKDFAFGERNIDKFKQSLGAIQEVLTRAAAESKKLQETFGTLQGTMTVFGGMAPASIRPLVDELLKSKDLTKEMRGQLEGMNASPSWQTMASKAEEFGISLSALGGKFQEARITDIALQYARDIDFLVENGADVVGMLEGMQDEMSELYNEAVKSGVALPESLKPYMQRLVEMEKLVDDNGDAVKDLNKVAFKEIEDKALKDVVDVLTEIKNLLATGLPQAARDAASGMNSAFRTVTPPNVTPTTGAAGAYERATHGGENGTTQPEVGLQGGTHGRFVDWGSGTDVTLHGRERVMTMGEHGGGQPVHVTVVTTLDGAVVARNQVRHIPKVLGLAGM